MSVLHNEKISKTLDQASKSQASIDETKELVKKIASLEDELAFAKTNKPPALLPVAPVHSEIRRSVMPRLSKARSTVASLHLAAQLEKARIQFEEDDDSPRGRSDSYARPQYFTAKDERELRASLRTSLHDENKAITVIFDAMKTCVSKANRASLIALEDIQNLVKQTEEEKAEIESELEAAYEQIEELEKKFRDVEIRLKEAEAVQSVALKEVDNIQRTKEEIERSYHELVVKTSKAESVFQRQMSIETDTREDLINSLKNEITTLSNDRENLRTKVKELSSVISQGEEARVQNEEKLVNLRAKLDKLETESTKAKVLVEVLQNEKQRLESTLQNVKEELHQTKTLYSDQIEELHAKIALHERHVPQTAINFDGITSNKLLPLEMEEDEFKMSSDRKLDLSTIGVPDEDLSRKETVPYSMGHESIRVKELEELLKDAYEKLEAAKFSKSKLAEGKKIDSKDADELEKEIESLRSQLKDTQEKLDLLFSLTKELEEQKELTAQLRESLQNSERENIQQEEASRKEISSLQEELDRIRKKLEISESSLASNSKYKDDLTSLQLALEQALKTIEELKFEKQIYASTALELEAKKEELRLLSETMKQRIDALESGGLNSDEAHKLVITSLREELRNSQEETESLRLELARQKIQFETKMEISSDYYCETKLVLQNELADRESEILGLLKKNKVLRFKVEEYERNIREYNARNQTALG